MINLTCYLMLVWHQLLFRNWLDCVIVVLVLRLFYDFVGLHLVSQSHYCMVSRVWLACSCLTSPLVLFSMSLLSRCSLSHIVLHPVILSHYGPGSSAMLSAARILCDQFLSPISGTFYCPGIFFRRPNIISLLRLELCY